MDDAFVAANAQSHRWEPKFAIPQGYRLLSAADAAQAQSCLETHGADTAKCGGYQNGQARALSSGFPASDRTHTHALVSVIKCAQLLRQGGNLCSREGRHHLAARRHR